MRFDLSSIPTNATVSSATLSMNAFWKNGSNAFTFGIYKITRAWNENYTTWTTYDQNKNWTSAGGDKGAKVASFSSPSGYDVPKVDNFDMKAAVQDAVRNPASNFGWLFVDESGSDGHGYRTSQYATQSQRPKLTVVYTTPTAAGGSAVRRSLGGALSVSGGTLAWTRGGAVSVAAVDGRKMMERHVAHAGAVPLELPSGQYFAIFDGSGRTESVRFSVAR